MTFIRMTFRSFIAAMLLAAFSLPAGAADPEKIYSINVPTPLGTNPVAVTIKNETPNGNSTINSFIIAPPAGVSVTVASPKASAAADVTKGADGKIYVKAFDGLKSGNKTPKTLTVYLNATYDPAPTCASSYTWTAVVYTGNAFGNETFALNVGQPADQPDAVFHLQVQHHDDPLGGARGDADDADGPSHQQRRVDVAHRVGHADPAFRLGPVHRRLQHVRDQHRPGGVCRHRGSGIRRLRRSGRHLGFGRQDLRRQFIHA